MNKPQIGKDITIDDAIAMQEQGKLIIKAHVFQNGEWTFRELTSKEIIQWAKLTGYNDET